MQKTFTTKSDAETIALGSRLGSRLRGGEFIALTGDLGGGKTQFTKGIAAGLGITETIVSPTFTIERIYCSREQSESRTKDENSSQLRSNNITLHHFDLYRTLDDREVAESIKDLSPDDDNIVVVEWPENIAGIVPENSLRVEFKYTDETTREIVLNSCHPEWERRIQGLDSSEVYPELAEQGQNDEGVK